MTSNEEAVKVLDLVGITALFVDGLGAEAKLSLESRVLLIDKALRIEDVADIVDQTVTRVIEVTVESLTAPAGRA